MRIPAVPCDEAVDGGGVDGDGDGLGERDGDLVEAHGGRDLLEERSAVLRRQDLARLERRGDDCVVPAGLLTGRRREVPRVDGQLEK